MGFRDAIKTYKYMDVKLCKKLGAYIFDIDKLLINIITKLDTVCLGCDVPRLQKIINSINYYCDQPTQIDNNNCIKRIQCRIAHIGHNERRSKKYYSITAKQDLNLLHDQITYLMTVLGDYVERYITSL